MLSSECSFLLSCLRKYNSACGTVSLGYLFGSIGFAFIVGAIYTTSSYVGAQATLDSAARAAARCLSPIAGECVMQSPDISSDGQSHWYQVRNMPRNTVSVSRQVVHYGSSMSRRSYSPTVRVGETQMVHPQVSFSTYDVPQLVLQPVYRIVDGNAVFESSIYRPSHSSPVHFPSFEQDESSPSSAWIGSHQQPPFVNSGQMQRVIAPGTIGDFAVTINIPSLDPSVTECIDNNGQPCEVASLAGAPKDNNAWRNTAYVALKVMSEVTSADPRNSTVVKWAIPFNEPDRRAGLWVDVMDAHGNVIEPDVCLGGRVYSSDIGNTPQWYHLWLRGPDGAHGGGTPGSAEGTVCPGGKRIHDNMAVPRGGSLRVRAYLYVRNDVAPANAKVTIAWMFDQYQKVTNTKAVAFSPVFDSRDVIVAPRPSDVGLDSAKWRLAGRQTNKWVGKTFAELATIQPSSKTPPKVAVCDTRFNVNKDGVMNVSENAYSWLPQYSQTFRSDLETKYAGMPKPANRFYGLRVLPFAEPVSVGAVPNACVAAKKVEHSVITCAQSIAKNETFKDLASCQVSQGMTLSANELSKYSTAVAALNKSQLYYRYNSSPTLFGEMPTLKLVGTVPAERRYDVLALGESRSVGSSVIEISENLFQPVVRYEEVGGNYTSPKVDEFLPQLEKVLSSYAPINMVLVKRNPANYVALKAKQIDDQTFESLYPFNANVNPIYYGQLIENSTVDFNYDCVADEVCNDYSGQVFASEEAALRNYASSLVPEAIRKNDRGDYIYEFDTGVKELGIEEVMEVDAGELSTSSYSCVPHINRCNTYSTQTTVDLGVSRVEPDICRVSGDCYSVPLAEEIRKDPKNYLQTERAEYRAFQEMQRMVNNAVLAYGDKKACDNADKRCVNLETDLSDPLHVKVKATYNMPVLEPYASLIGSDMLYLSSEKEEILETVSLGVTK